MASKYSVGIDFGTESGRASWSTSRRARAGNRRLRIRQRRDRRAPAGSRRRCPPGSRLGAAGPGGLHRARSAGRAGGAVAAGVDPADVMGMGIDFTACTMLPDHGGRHAALHAARVPPPSRTPGSSCGSTTPPSPRPTASTRSPASAARRGCRATAARSPPSGSSPRRCRSSTRRRRSTRAADRLIEAADWVIWQLTGRRDAQHLHGRLQGDLVEAGRLPAGRDYFAALRPALRARGRREDVARASCPSAQRRAG